MSSVRIMTLSSLSFFCLLLLSGALGGAIGTVIYYLALPLTAAAALFLLRGRLSKDRMLYIKRKELVESLVYIFPGIVCVMAVSYLSGLALSLFGMYNPVKITEPLPKAILIYAVYPAIFEELLFRYIPLRLSEKTPRGVLVISSSLFFALVHADLASVPYAIIAGAIFMLVDLKYKSVLPSLIMHAFNNVASVLFTLYSSSLTFLTVYFSLIILLSLFSLAVIIKRKNELWIFSGKQLAGTFGTLECYKDIILLAIPTILVAIAKVL